MKKFSYVAVNPQTDEVIREEVSATNLAEVKSSIEAQDLDLVTIEEIKKKGRFDFSFSKGISLLKKVEFANQLSLMLKAGISIVEALDIIKQGSKNQYFKDVMGGIQHSIESGSSLSSALENYPNVFDSVFISMVRAGEKSGNLDEVLTDLANELKRDYRLIKEVTSALIYPGVIVSTLVLISLAMFIFVVPKVAKVYERLDVALPLSTKIFLTVGTFMATYWWVVIPGILVLALGFYWAVKSDEEKKILASIEKRLPVLSDIYYQFNYSRFTRVLATLLKSGVPINKSMELTAKSIDDEEISTACQKISKELEEGVNLSQSMEKRGFFPINMTKIVEVGERTGRLDSILIELSDHYTEELKDNLSRFTSLIEPVLVVLIGIAIGVMVISLIGPIYGIIGEVQR